MGIAYQLFAWKEAVEKAYGFKGFYLVAQNKNRITGVLPLIHVKSPFSPGSLVSLPYCDAGGPLADSPDIEKKMILKAFETAKYLRIRKLSVRSVNKVAGINPELTVNEKKVRMILQLPENSEIFFSSLKAKVRSQAKKPIKDGLSIQAGGVEFLDLFFQLFSENMRDLGSPTHSKKWFKSILSSYKNRSLLFVVKTPDQIPAAGGIILCHPNMVSVPWASSLRRFNKLNPNMLLYSGFLTFASNNGYPLFDFGRSTPDEGTFRFKKQWGAKPTHLHWIDLESADRDLLKVKSGQKGISEHDRFRKIAESVIMKTPVSISTVFGNITRKYITL